MKPISLLMGLWLSAGTASAQLAITEVMSAATNRFGDNIVSNGPDYWELTNFSDHDVDLNGYRFGDEDKILIGADPLPFQNLVIQAGESILFFESQNNAISPDAFRAWWGLDESVRVVPYTGRGFGLNPDGDVVRLWGPNALDDADLIDMVEFGVATPGHSITYAAGTGEFNVVSSLDMFETFPAATAWDVGSPGAHGEPVPARVTQEPTNVVAIPGDTVTFSVGFYGRPRPRFEWYFNDALLWGEHRPSLTINEARPEFTGVYRVVLNNGINVVSSRNVTLGMRTDEIPPFFRVFPTEVRAFVDQPAVFHSRAVGNPAPGYQWRCDGTNIPGAIFQDLEVSQFQDPGIYNYAVVASNSHGSVTSVVQLIVTERPNLRITELMPSERSWNGAKHGSDWWELTNFGSNTVDLIGYRFDDFNDSGSQDLRPQFTQAWVLTNHILIGPQESIIFVEAISTNSADAVNAFRQWWGRTNLLPNLQIIPYSGKDLGLSDKANDGLSLWNSSPNGNDDVVNGEFTAVTYSKQQITAGVSFTTNPDAGPLDCCRLLSKTGVNGAFISAEGGDIGSPGYVRAPTDVRVLSMTMTSSGCELIWRSVQSGSYQVECSDSLEGGQWRVLTNMSPSGPTTTFLDTEPHTAAQRFYRVVLTAGGK